MLERDDGFVTTNRMRRDQFAAGATALRENLTVPGADGVFDVALTNGLLAIVAHAIPGHAAAKTTGHLPAARKLLGELASTFGKDSRGITEVPTGENAFDLDARMVLTDLGYERKVPVRVDLLLDALARTQPARHGRGPTGLLTRTDVEALEALDEHPALGVLAEYSHEEYWARGSEADGVEWDRAMEFLEMLTEKEVAARVKAVKITRGSLADDHDLQFCPVCGNQSLVATGGDDWGYGIVAGTCQVCSYRQSEHAAEELNLQEEWELRWAHE